MQMEDEIEKLTNNMLLESLAHKFINTYVMKVAHFGCGIEAIKKLENTHRKMRRNDFVNTIFR